jgi:hypothetical protein
MYPVASSYTLCGFGLSLLAFLFSANRPLLKLRCFQKARIRSLVLRVKTREAQSVNQIVLADLFPLEDEQNRVSNRLYLLD